MKPRKRGSKADPAGTWTVEEMRTALDRHGLEVAAEARMHVAAELLGGNALLRGELNQWLIVVTGRLWTTEVLPTVLSFSEFNWLAKRRPEEMVQILVEAGADPNAGNGLPVLWAARDGNLEIVRVLLEAGGDAKTKEALQVAVSQGHAEIVRFMRGAPAGASG